ncbi:MAG: PEP-CTERM sorting domain-containing protein, partial [Planctomycetes bacterium]|nr:PEP-CTERM sorting domain-containing protein [Planctomycetota bacterium]
GLSQEAFAFSFANPVGTPENYTATASFTSSAIPEPASIALLAIGGLLALRRRATS